MAAAVFPDDRVFPPLGPSAHQPREPSFVVARRLDEPAAGKIARREIFGRVLAPADIRQASATALDRIRLIQVPFWRVEVAIDGFHVSITSVPLGRGPIGLPLPRMSSKHRSGAVMVSARNAFPYQLRVPSSLSHSVFVGIPALEVAAEDLVPEAADDSREGEGEIVGRRCRARSGRERGAARGAECRRARSGDLQQVRATRASGDAGALPDLLPALPLRRRGATSRRRGLRGGGVRAYGHAGGGQTSLGRARCRRETPAGVLVQIGAQVPAAYGVETFRSSNSTIVLAP